LKIQFQRNCILRNVDVEGPNVDSVTHPRKTFAICRGHKPGHVSHLIRRRVRSGQPLWVEQRNFARLYRNRLTHIQHTVIDVR